MDLFNNTEGEDPAYLLLFCFSLLLMNKLYPNLIDSLFTELHVKTIVHNAAIFIVF